MECINSPDGSHHYYVYAGNGVYQCAYCDSRVHAY